MGIDPILIAFTSCTTALELIISYTYIYIINSTTKFKIQETSRPAAARGVTVKPTGCGFDPHSRR